MKEKSESEVAQSCPTLSDPTDCSPPGSSVHGILQARVLEWVAIAFSVSFIGYYKISSTIPSVDSRPLLVDICCEMITRVSLANIHHLIYFEIFFF